MIVEVIINSSAKKLNKSFDYIVPKELEKEIKIGARVFVPFGRIKLQEAYIISIKENSEFANKNILKIEDYMLSEEQITLAKLMANRYFCNISDCIKLMLPPGNSKKDINARTKEKKLNFVILAKDREQVKIDLENKLIKTEKQRNILKFFLENEKTTISELEKKIEVSSSTIKLLINKGYLEIIEEHIDRNPFLKKEIQKDKPLKLSQEQMDAYQSIIKSQYSQYLLYGITGSGKTEVYLQVIQKKLEEGKNAIVLVPEISLTPQMVNRFRARFGDTIAVLHSKLSPGERFDQWNIIKQGKARIVIGARSAIFSPIKNLGIIIIDEEHDTSYKSDSTPRYNAKDLANYIAKQNNIPIVYGSATPNITSFYKSTETNQITLLKLTSRANKSSLPKVQIVDLRNELIKGNKSIISDELYEAIEKNLQAKKQTILFLNRRGFSTFVMCRDCGHTMKCKRCNISLTYHRKENILKCHYCGYQIKNIKDCPKCNSNKIKFFGAGTQKLEEYIKQQFPQASTIRLDIDTVSEKNSHEKILERFKKEGIDILIGTQMVVKGHHFPNVTLVGVISADGFLNIPDYSSNEKTFSLLTQVAGRAGRENNEGEVFIQTYAPENFCIEYAREQNYEKFYKTEIQIRKQLKYPPFCDIINIAVNSKNKEEVENASKKIYDILKEQIEKLDFDINMFKPLPAPVDRIKNIYRWRIIIKARLNSKIIDTINKSLIQFYKLNFKQTNIIVDVNPNNMQ